MLISLTLGRVKAPLGSGVGGLVRSFPAKCSPTLRLHMSRKPNVNTYSREEFFAKPTPPQDRSERDVVVHVAVARASGDRPARCRAAAEIAAGFLGAKAASARAAALEHGQVRVESLQHHFGGVFFDAALVGPFAGLQLAFEVNFCALLQILLGDFAQPFIEDHDPVPFGLFLALAGGLVAPAFRGGYAQIGDRPAVLGPPDFRILAEIADQNHLVHTSRHHCSPRLNLLDRPGTQAAEAARLPRPVIATRPPRRATLYARWPRGRADPGRRLGYPHIAPFFPVFQFCSLPCVILWYCGFRAPDGTR